MSGGVECSYGEAAADLDVAGVRTTLYNVGNLFSRGWGTKYEVPKGSGSSAIYTLGLWVGGEVRGLVRFAGATYSAWEFWPGPLDASGTVTPSTCSAFDRFWTVNLRDIQDYEAGVAAGTTRPDGSTVEYSGLQTWPIAFGAPFFVDTNGNGRRDPDLDADEDGQPDEPRLTLDLGDPGYGTRPIDPRADEFPDIVGDQGVWWVMNDAGGAHLWSESPPLGVEVQVLAYAFAAEDRAVSQATFYEYTVVNRSAQTITDSRVSFFSDIDLGNFEDDYMAGDSGRGMLVGYNSDGFDDGQHGYGRAVPAVGIDLLSGAQGAIAWTWAGIDGVTSPPWDTEGAWRSQQSLWVDGTPITRGGNGYNPGATDVTRWSFDGDPVTASYWTEEQPLPDGQRRAQEDRKGGLNAGPVTLAPGARRRVDVAVLFAEGDSVARRSRLHSVARLQNISDAVQAAYDEVGPAGIGGVTVSYATPPPAPAPPGLVAPADGADFEAAGRPGEVSFAWTAVASADRYTLQLSSAPDFSSDLVEYQTSGTEMTVEERDLLIGTSPIYWRVVAEHWGGWAASATRQFIYYAYNPVFDAFEVIANANGPLDPPAVGGATWAGFPVSSNEGNLDQQANGTVWLISVAEARDVQSFLDLGLRNENAGSFFPFDYEIRFDGSSLARKDGVRGQTGPPIEIPFEIWNIGVGTPDDPSDDVRLIPYIWDRDGNGFYGLATLDSPLSSGADDPETDGVTWYEPVDMTPGEAGYLAYENGGTLDVTQVGGELIAATTFVGWNLGDVPPYAAPYPEAGTIFRLDTADPARPTPEAGGPDPASLGLAVYPNPASQTATVAYALAAPTRTRVAVYDVLGREVLVLADGLQRAGTHRLQVEAGRLAPGLYVAVLEAGGVRQSERLIVAR